MADPVNILFGTPNLDAVKRDVLGLVSVFDRVARMGQRSIEGAARAQVRAEVTAARETDRAATVAARAKDRAARDGTRAVERALREEHRIRNAINALEIREYHRAEREKTRISETEARNRLAAARRTGSAFGGATSRVLGASGKVMGIASALGGGFTLADSLRAGIQNEATAGTIFRGAQNKGDFSSSQQVERLAQKTAIATGGSSQDVLGGLDQFVRRTGDLGAAKNMLEDLARLSAAASVDFADMGATAAEVQNQLGDAAKTMEVMRALAGQGRAGAIDIKDLGQYGGRLAASAAQFGGSLSGNIESFGAIAQLARKLGGADVAEATMAVQHLPSDFAKNEDRFKAIGVDVFTDKTKTKFRSAEDVITESVVKSKGNQAVLGELFGERSIRAARGAQVAFTNAGGGAAGEAAIRGQFSALRSSTMTTEQVDEGVRDRLRENEAKLNIAHEQLHRAINEKLLPKLPELIESFSQLIPTISKVVGVFADFPAASIVGIIGVAFTRDIAAAGIGNAVRDAIVRLMTSGGPSPGTPPPTPTPGTGAGPSGALGLIGRLLPGAVIAGEGAKQVQDAIQNSAGKKLMGDLVRSDELTGKITAGTATPEEIEEARARSKQLGELGVGGRSVAGEGAMGALGADVGALVKDLFGGGGGQAQREAEKAAAANMDKVAETSTKLAAALERLGIVADSIGTGGAPAGPIADSKWPP